MPNIKVAPSEVIDIVRQSFANRGIELSEDVKDLCRDYLQNRLSSDELFSKITIYLYEK